MNFEDVDKEYLKECSDEEIMLWFNEYQRREEAKAKRQFLLDNLDIQDAKKVSF